MAWQKFYKQFILYEGYIDVLKGLLVTVEVAVLGLIIGIILGTLIAITKVIPKEKPLPRILSFFSDIYVGFFRGTPMVVQLLIGYFVLMPAVGLHLDNVVVAIIMFGMNSGAYISEIMRSGIQSVDGGQLEAARALGLPYSKSMMKH